MGKEGKLKKPFESVSDSERRPVCVSVADTVAPTMAAPVESVTMPEMLPVMAAQASAAPKRVPRISANTNLREKRMKLPPENHLPLRTNHLRQHHGGPRIHDAAHTKRSPQAETPSRCLARP